MTLETESLEYIAWANDEIRKQAAEIEALREAIDDIIADYEDGRVTQASINKARRARAAIAETTPRPSA